MFYIVKERNYDATKFYLDILERSATLAGQVTKQIDSRDMGSSNSKDIYLISNPLGAFKLSFIKKKRFIYWFQGVVSEESYMKHKSSLRRFIIQRIEKYILKKAEYIYFVSSEMKDYYSNLFGINLKENHYIMPCFNSTINKNSFLYENKYNKNIFCYAGSLSVWQGFDKILACYKYFEGLGIHGTKLLILTNEKEKAKELINLSGIKNYEIDYVQLKNIDNALSQAKFGFILREDVIVNRVATPTKISTYMANGLIPIFSECLVDFANISKDLKYTINFDEKDSAQRIRNFMLEKIDPNAVYGEYSKLFETYFSGDYHARKIAKLIKNIL